jgi:hypothetical protein
MSLIKQTKMALDESRMLMLGAQILFGFQFQAPFQNAFEALSWPEKVIEIVVLCIMIVVIGLLILPSARHRIYDQGEASVAINRFITSISGVTLLPFALALALDLALVGTQLAGLWGGILSGVAGGSVAIVFWYGGLMVKQDEARKPMPDDRKPEKTPPGAKIDYVLTEARVVLPGAQALLGFQFAVVLTNAFAVLPSLIQAIHGLSASLIALATILLITPAAYHRLVYGGEEILEFHRIASRLVLAATVFLALGLSADAFVVVYKITDSQALATGVASASTLLLFGLWHVWPWWLSAKKKKGDAEVDSAGRSIHS